MVMFVLLLLITFFLVCLQPRLVLLTKAKMRTMEILATMATPIMPTIKQCFTMMLTLKLDNKLVHRFPSIIIQKVSNLHCSGWKYVENLFKLFINVCYQFTAQVGITNQGNNGNINRYNGNNGNNAFNNNPNNANNQAIFHNDANTQVEQQFGSPNTFNNHPDGKQQSPRQISIFALCHFYLTNYKMYKAKFV